MSLLQELIQDGEPSLKGLAVHRLRQDAAAAWPSPGVHLLLLSIYQLPKWGLCHSGIQKHEHEDLELSHIP